MKKSIFTLFTLSLIFSFAGCSKKNQAVNQSLNIYSIIHEEETEALTKLFSEKTGIQVKYLRASTGELVNRVLTEKDNPNADLLLGGASSYHIQLDKNDALLAYKSPFAKNLPEYAKSSDDTWTGFCVLSLGIGVNTQRYKEKFPDLPLPSSWDDLTNPLYKGEIVITNPLSSSTAYLFVQNQLQRLGWDKGWEYLEKLAPLVGQFPDSGSAPAKLIGSGEYSLGVSYIHAINKYRSEGFNVIAIAPSQSAGDVDCISIMKNTKNVNAAKKFVDFMLSVEAQELMSSLDFTVPVNPEAKGIEGSVPLSELDLIAYDVNKASEEKDKVLDLWSKTVK
ncbi:MAG: ABC transporter substrate-binding protein [Treponema sp.]|nr:ABC transporter substrate-binding protein [Treponema sp.]